MLRFLSSRVARLFVASSLALGLGAMTAEASGCGYEYAGAQTAVCLRTIPGPFVIMDTVIADPVTNCSGTIANILLWGPSSQPIWFDFCGRTHFYVPETGTWLDAVTDCDALGYINV